MNVRLSPPDPRDAWDGYQPFANVGRRNVLQETLEVPLMVRALGLPLGARILEVGCGRGVALPPLARLCAPRRLVGLDIDAAFLEEAARRLAERGVTAELHRGDVRRLPFPDGSFDIVIDFGTCYHIARAAEALSEIARVLVPGGILVHETRLSQLLSHPIRSFGRTLPWHAAGVLVPYQRAVLWSARRKRVTPAPA